MANSNRWLSARTATLRLSAGLIALGACSCLAIAQQQLTGFAVDRFYPAPPGSGWLVMDDLKIAGGLGGALNLNSDYGRMPLPVPGMGGASGFGLVTDEEIVNVGAAVTYGRYRAYVNLPVPVVLSGTSGVSGTFELTAPALNPGSNPDAVADPTLGFDARLLGAPDGLFRLGAGAQLIFPSGSRSQYVSDARYRGMLRLLAAGDKGAYSWAAQTGVHLRPLHDSLIPGGPNGNEFLFGGSVGRRVYSGADWSIFTGPEIFGETAFASYFSQQESGTEALLGTRFERMRGRRGLRIKAGLGHALLHHFGAAQWRILLEVEITGQRAGDS